MLCASSPVGLISAGVRRGADLDGTIPLNLLLPSMQSTKTVSVSTNWPPDRRERRFFLSMLVAVWLAILSGFAYNNMQKFVAGRLTYPWIVHIHALVFTGWLVFFTAQLVLVHRGQVSAHRRLGMFGAGLAALMVVLGVMTAISTEQYKFGTPASDPPFLSVMFSDMLIFGGLVTAALLVRRSPAAHKRLMLIATLVLTDAGFGRWLSPKIVEWAGHKNYWELKTFAEGAWPFIRFQLLPAYTLIAALGVFDLLTRKRLHPMYIRAVACCLPIHLVAGWLYFQPFWRAIALQIVGR